MRFSKSAPQHLYNMLYIRSAMPAEMKAVRNLDGETYKRFKAYAALEGRPIGHVLSDAMRAYMHPGRGRGRR